MGISPLHSSSVKLIRNLETGYISPQFYVVFHKCFSTIPSNQDLDLNALWENLYNMSWEHVPYNGKDPDNDLRPTQLPIPLLQLPLTPQPQNSHSLNLHYTHNLCLLFQLHQKHCQPTSTAYTYNYDYTD